MNCNGLSERSISILGIGYIHSRGEAASVEAPGELPLPPIRLRMCEGPLGKGTFPPNRLRRLGRSQKLALIAAQAAMSNAPIPPEDLTRSAVCVGTGLGEQGETAAFLENMIRFNENAPKPVSFANSVHNSMASQIAIEHGFKGESYTISHDEVSFELALWQAVALLRSGSAKYALACSVDEAHPYSALAGDLFGCWDARTDWKPGEDAPLPPLIMPGEGSAAFLLKAAGAVGPYLRGVKVRPVCNNFHGGNTPSEDDAAFIEEALRDWGMAGEDLDLLLLGANGKVQLHREYNTLTSSFCMGVGKRPCFGVYKQICGEFHTAPGIGFALAAQMIQSEGIVDDVMIVRGKPPVKFRHIGLFQVGTSFRSLCVISG